MKKRVETMGELASELGVARATLSKYFKDANSVRQSVRDRIVDGLQKIDYVPNFFARNLNRKQTGILGVIIPHLNDFFYMDLVKEIECRADELGFSVIVQDSRGNADGEARALEIVRSMNVDGVIAAPTGSAVNIGLFESASAQCPVIFVDAKCPGFEEKFSFVGSDNTQAIGLMVDYLCRSGGSPVFLGMPIMNSNASERETAYRERMKAKKLKPVVLDRVSSYSGWDFEKFAYEEMKVHLGRGKLHDATILCANDRLAIGVLRAANEAGVMDHDSEEPTGFRVAGHDDHPMSQYVWPSLTTVGQDVSKIGRTAVDRILELSKEDSCTGHVTQTLFPATLAIRRSA